MGQGRCNMVKTDPARKMPYEGRGVRPGPGPAPRGERTVGILPKERAGKAGNSAENFKKNS